MEGPSVATILVLGMGHGRGYYITYYATSFTGAGFYKAERNDAARI